MTALCFSACVKGLKRPTVRMLCNYSFSLLRDFEFAEESSMCENEGESLTETEIETVINPHRSRSHLVLCCLSVTGSCVIDEHAGKTRLVERPSVYWSRHTLPEGNTSVCRATMSVKMNTDGEFFFFFLLPSPKKTNIHSWCFGSYCSWCLLWSCCCLLCG